MPGVPPRILKKGDTKKDERSKEKIEKNTQMVSPSQDLSIS